MWVFVLAPVNWGTNAVSKRGERDEDQSRQLQLPVTGFGPFTASTATQGCLQSNTDKWAFGTCTLLVPAPGQKKATATADGEQCASC